MEEDVQLHSWESVSSGRWCWSILNIQEEKQLCELFDLGKVRNESHYLLFCSKGCIPIKCLVKTPKQSAAQMIKTCMFYWSLIWSLPTLKARCVIWLVFIQIPPALHSNRFCQWFMKFDRKRCLSCFPIFGLSLLFGSVYAALWSWLVWVHGVLYSHVGWVIVICMKQLHRFHSHFLRGSQDA